MLDIWLSPGQGNLLKRAVASIVNIAEDEQASINYSPEGISLIALDSTHWVVAALHLKSLSFTFFSCHDGNYAAGVNLGEFYQILNFAGDNDFITIHCDDGEMGFKFENPRTRQVMPSEMLLTKVNNDHVDIDDLQYEYEKVIGIPSQKFRLIIMHLGFFGDTVSITVMDTQVKFSAVNEEIVLSKENGECIIGGAADDHPVHLLFSLYHKSSFLNASLLSSTVWILQSNTSPTLLNCPVAAVGNIMFYFV